MRSNVKDYYIAMTNDKERHLTTLSNAMRNLAEDGYLASAAAIALCWQRAYPGEPLPSFMHGYLQGGM